MSVSYSNKKIRCYGNSKDINHEDALMKITSDSQCLTCYGISTQGL